MPPSKEHIDFTRNPENHKQQDAIVAKYPFEKFFDDIQKNMKIVTSSDNVLV